MARRRRSLARTSRTRWAPFSSAALMLETLGLKEEAAALDAAVKSAVVQRKGTKDIGGKLGTRETGDWIAAELSDARETHESLRG